MAKNGGNPNIRNIGKETRIKSSEQAREMQRKGVQKRKENRTFRELLAEQLEKGERKKIGMDKLANKIAEGDLNAIKLGGDILGENENTINIKSDGFNIVVSNKETSQKLKEILNADNEDI